MNNIFIATSSFAVHSNKPIKILEERKETIFLNPLSRKMSSDELLKYASGTSFIITGLIYTISVALAFLKFPTLFGASIKEINEMVKMSLSTSLKRDR